MDQWQQRPGSTHFSAAIRSSQSWFGRDSCLVRRGEDRDLVVRGALVASWKEGETAIRNIMLVQLCKEPGLVLEDIAKAFRLTSEAIRLIRRKAEREGILAVMLPAKYGRNPVAPELRQQMEGLFAQGQRVEDVFRKMGGRVARPAVSKYHRLWLVHAKEVSPPVPAQQSLPLAEAALQPRQKCDLMPRSGNRSRVTRQRTCWRNIDVPAPNSVQACSSRIRKARPRGQTRSDPRRQGASVSQRSGQGAPTRRKYFVAMGPTAL